jgi:hypothetical protein
VDDSEEVDYLTVPIWNSAVFGIQKGKREKREKSGRK